MPALEPQDHPVGHGGAAGAAEREKVGEGAGQSGGEGGANTAARTVEPGLGGFRPDAELAGGRFGAQALDVAQDDDQAQRLGEVVDAGLEQAAGLGAAGFGLGAGRRRGAERDHPTVVEPGGLDLGEIRASAAAGAGGRAPR